VVTVEKMIKYVGWTILIVGIICGIYLGTSLKIGGTDSYGIENDALNPLRWVYGFLTILSSAFFGCVLIGINGIIERINQLK
jgi:hypothetical protein